MSLLIYYLDDEVALTEVFSEIFSSEKVQIRTFSDVEPALLAIQSEPLPDAVFIDFRLPHTTGDLVAQKMPAQIPKYLLSGEVNPLPQYPFKEILSKPYDVSRITQLLSELSDKK